MSYSVPHPFKLVDSENNNYDLSNGAVHAYKKNGSHQYFTLSGPSPNTVIAQGYTGFRESASAHLHATSCLVRGLNLSQWASALAPTSRRSSISRARTRSLAPVDTTTAPSGSVPFACVVTATQAPVIFCRGSGPNLYASSSGSCGSYTQVAVYASGSIAVSEPLAD